MPPRAAHGAWHVHAQGLLFLSFPKKIRERRKSRRRGRRRRRRRRRRGGGGGGGGRRKTQKKKIIQRGDQQATHHAQLKFSQCACLGSLVSHLDLANNSFTSSTFFCPLYFFFFFFPRSRYARICTTHRARRWPPCMWIGISRLRTRARAKSPSESMFLKCRAV